MSEEVPALESVVARLRPHARALFWPSLALIVACGAAGFLYGSFADPWQNMAVLIAAAVVVVLFWFLPLVSWLGKHYTITTRRIVIRSGLLVRVRQELLHSRGYDVTVRKAGLQVAFGSGDVLVNTGLDRPVILRDVPGADLVQEVLSDLMEASQNSVASRRQQDASRSSDETTRWGSR
ncbi:MAG: hypothetical protein JWR53_797 [Glaciihabitans sp.]|jgi:membrane protein YdbS with pleckstrin-like domain|nr:hypothetical protein [Glaciihabitans sp.]